MFNLVSKKVTDCIERNKFRLLVLLGILLFLVDIVIASSVLIFIGTSTYLLFGGVVNASPWLQFASTLGLCACIFEGLSAAIRTIHKYFKGITSACKVSFKVTKE